MARQKVLTSSLGNCELPAWANALNSGDGRAQFPTTCVSVLQPVMRIGDTPHSNFAFALARNEASLSRQK